jgi:hypothetical protein
MISRNPCCSKIFTKEWNWNGISAHVARLHTIVHSSCRTRLPIQHCSKKTSRAIGVGRKALWLVVIATSSWRWVYFYYSTTLYDCECILYVVVQLRQTPPKLDSRLHSGQIKGIVAQFSRAGFVTAFYSMQRDCKLCGDTAFVARWPVLCFDSVRSAYS